MDEDAELMHLMSHLLGQSLLTEIKPACQNSNVNTQKVMYGRWQTEDTNGNYNVYM